MKNLKILSVGFGAALVFGGVAWAASVTVDQKNLQFSTPSLKVAKGDIVEFKNSDDTSHNITIKGDNFQANSGLQAPGTPFKVPMVKPGAYKVTCGIHPNMKMTIVVE